jgi:hypothetical protein
LKVDFFLKRYFRYIYIFFYKNNAFFFQPCKNRSKLTKEDEAELLEIEENNPLNNSQHLPVEPSLEEPKLKPIGSEVLPISNIDDPLRPDHQEPWQRPAKKPTNFDAKYLKKLSKKFNCTFLKFSVEAPAKISCYRSAKTRLWLQFSARPSSIPLKIGIVRVFSKKTDKFILVKPKSLPQKNYRVAKFSIFHDFFIILS